MSNRFIPAAEESLSSIVENDYAKARAGGHV
jgi:hypothetical protein